MSILGNTIIHQIERLPDYRIVGQVTQVVGLLLEVGGVEGSVSVGDYCTVYRRNGTKVLCEAVGFRENKALVMPFGSLDGVGLGCRVEIAANDPAIFPDESWLGRVINAFGEPVDGKGPLGSGNTAFPIHGTPPSAHSRRRVGGKVDLGVKAMNAFLTVCQGQRLGIFAGSGIGKSTLLSMMARNTSADVNVIGLVGERGREAREFIEDDLGPEGLAKSVVVVATSDEPPLVRRQAAYVTMAVAEYMRNRGHHVLCLMDSVTRFAMAQREIGLSAGEPPASKGYTPSVFAELPRLMERAGPGHGQEGDITALFTVLVEGDDHNEPVADAVRGILDGHVVLSRDIAQRNRYPAIDVLRSVSRTMPRCNSDYENALVSRARGFMATYEDMAELIRLGAYRRGSDKAVDEAIHYYPRIEEFLGQKIDESDSLKSCYEMLADALEVEPESTAPEQQADTKPAEQEAPKQDQQQQPKPLQAQNA
ncbi:MAG: flagellar protein export ATPase FliI [Rhodospirillales bacterium]